ncbi:MAG TPA: acyl-CoA synthetase [Caulobacteraceae bacterium]|jgi:acyl-CoA synthetase (AMP-forming)/AMP-acid ligase II|nr:acyl-CoA synthetase [Caulobacteraceae bacterium]
MKWCFADIFEMVADLAPDSLALINGETRRTWRAYEDRGARIAQALVAAGIERGAKVGLYGYNSNEYLEAQFGVFKARAVPVNVNYRYVEHELIYLLENADAEAVVFDAQFAPRLAAIRERLPKLKLFVRIDDGSGGELAGALDFEAVIAGHDRLARMEASEDDVYMLYTGGTTGLPKGVMYRQGDFTRGLAAAVLGPDAPPTGEALAAAIAGAHEAGATPVSLAACPLMHGTGLWLGVFLAHFFGGAAVTFRNEHFDPHALWRLVETEKVTTVSIVGDAFAKPMLVALREAQAQGRPYDLSSLKQILSSGVMLSTEVKRGLLEFADLTILDAMGSTEGSMGSSVVSRAAPPGETARFARNPTTKVFNDRDEEVEPGSDEIGMIANGGFAPIGYYKDPEKSARTFRTIRGQRYSFPGDFAKVAADGSLVLLGRGSVCINTGGEKVFPEEVEEALKAHDSVWDALVVGVPDERFGERVTAVISPRPGREIDEGELLTFVRGRIAGYKLPRRLIVVDTVRRAANGKADYRWAKEAALEAAGLN